jgi:hypothetical protein
VGVDEIDPRHLTLEFDLLAWIVTAGTMVRRGAFDEHRYREQGGDEYRVCHSCHLHPLRRLRTFGRAAKIVSLFSGGPPTGVIARADMSSDRTSRLLSPFEP